MTAAKPAPLAPSSGFSLLEVLVASAILGVVMMVLLSTLSTSIALWRNTENKAGADREARASELLLAQDLASVVIPSEPDLWPRVITNNGVQFLQFLTAKPPGYQSSSNDSGDVCYVEYTVTPSLTAPGAELRRMFWGSARTYDEILSRGSLRGGGGAGVATNADFQPLGLNLLVENRDAVRGLELAGSANNTHFVVLGRDLLPLTTAYSAANYPAAIEVNFAVADADALRNTNQLNNPNYVLRNAGLYSTRFYLPEPPPSP